MTESSFTMKLQISLYPQGGLKCNLNRKLLDLGSAEMAKWLKVKN